MLSSYSTYIKNLNFKQYNLFKKIKHQSNYLLFSRYYDLTSLELTLLKNKLKEKQIGFLTIKKSLVPSTEYYLKGQGPILIFYGQTFSDIRQCIDILNDQPKIELLFLTYATKSISIDQLECQCLSVSWPLPYILQFPLTKLSNTLFKISDHRRV